jgi:hypothetical protein
VHELEGHTVVAVIEFDVVVDVDASGVALAQLVACGGERQQRVLPELLLALNNIRVISCARGGSSVRPSRVA